MQQNSGKQPDFLSEEISDISHGEELVEWGTEKSTKQKNQEAWVLHDMFFLFDTCHDKVFLISREGEEYSINVVGKSGKEIGRISP